MSALDARMAQGLETVCLCWAVARTDGTSFGFTDHDLDLSFDGVTFRAGTGLSAKALSQTTGLSVDNTEAMGALSDAAVTEADIAAGRFDGAEVRIWEVDWTDPEARALRFRGSFGEVRRQGGRFEVELRGLAEALNQPQGRVYQGVCPAVLGDGDCGVDLNDPRFSHEIEAQVVEEGRVLRWKAFPPYGARWFEGGALRVVSGAAEGLTGAVKNDRVEGAGRVVELWEALRAPLAAGDRVRVTAGCDRRFETCATTFGNAVNFRGFPHIPPDDWVMSYPRGQMDGGAVR